MSLKTAELRPSDRVFFHMFKSLSEPQRDALMSGYRPGVCSSRRLTSGRSRTILALIRKNLVETRTVNTVHFGKDGIVERKKVEIYLTSLGFAVASRHYDGMF